MRLLTEASRKTAPHLANGHGENDGSSREIIQKLRMQITRDNKRPKFRQFIPQKIIFSLLKLE